MLKVTINAGKKEKEAARYLLLYLMVLALSYLVVAATQWVALRICMPYGVPALLFNIFLIQSVFLFLLLIFNQASSALLLGCILFTLLGAVNHIKAGYLNAPVVSGDVSMLSEAFAISTMYVNLPTLIALIVLPLLCIAAIVLLRVRRKRPLFSPAMRRGVLVLVVLCFCGCYAGGVYQKMYQPPRATAMVAARDIGYYWSLLVSFVNYRIEAPEGYGERFFAELRENVPAETDDAGTVRKPNIILILMESAVDPYKIREAPRFDRDPIPNMRALIGRGLIRNMISSEIGGMTCNVEFEVLTGLSMSYLPNGCTPYTNNFIKPGIPSLPAWLSELGYETKALHLNSGSFWNRNRVYQSMGFGEYLSLDNIDSDRYPIEKTKSWAKDKSMLPIITGCVEEVQEPLFLFGLTVENHGSYPDDKYMPEDFAVRAFLDGVEAPGLSVYAQGLYNTDAFVGELIDYFSECSEPTALIFFGDHAPVSVDERLSSMYYLTTPCGFWSNCGLVPPQEPMYFSASHIPELLLDFTGLPKGAWYGTLARYKEILPVNTRGWQIDGDGQQYTSMSDEMNKAYADLHILNYEALFGRGYIRKYLWPGGTEK